jgi:hypothetical protein
MRSSLALARARVKLPFGVKRPPTYHKKKRAKHVHQKNQNTVYTPGKNSPLYSMVEEVRALPLEWWEQKHRDGTLHE